MLKIDFAPLEPYFAFIDDKLCADRNTIAHGSDVKVNRETFREYRDTTIELMGVLFGQFENAIVQKVYLKAPGHRP